MFELSGPSTAASSQAPTLPSRPANKRKRAGASADVQPLTASSRPAQGKRIRLGADYEPSPLLLGNLYNRCARITKRLGFGPTVGLQRFACVGGIGMSLCGLTLALSGAPLSGLAVFGCGISVLLGFVITGIVVNFVERRRKLPLVKKEDLPELFRLKEELRAEGCPPNHEAWLMVNKTIALVQGGFWHTLREILRGTLLQVLVITGESVTTLTRYRLWRSKRLAAQASQTGSAVPETAPKLTATSQSKV